MQYTTNYNLNKPELSEQYSLAHWNDNMDSIDTQMKTEADARSAADTDLGGRIDDIEDGTTMVSTSEYAISAGKATDDSDGNAINTTYQKSANRKSSWSSTPSDDNYPSEKLVKDSLDGKANSSHTHAITDITNLQTLIDTINAKLATIISFDIVEKSQLSNYSGTYSFPYSIALGERFTVTIYNRSNTEMLYYTFPSNQTFIDLSSLKKVTSISTLGSVTKTYDLQRIQ